MPATAAFIRSVKRSFHIKPIGVSTGSHEEVGRRMTAGYELREATEEDAAEIHALAGELAELRGIEVVVRPEHDPAEVEAPQAPEDLGREVGAAEADQEELRNLALLFDVDRRGRLDVVDAEDPRRGARDWTESSTVSAARVDTVRG